MSKYRRIEINAYHRKVTVVSGEWRPGDVFDAQPAQTDDEVTLNDSDVCEPVAPDSPEGQLILVEAVRSLEQRLSPEGRALLCAGQNKLARPTNFSLSSDLINGPRLRSQPIDDKLKLVGHSSPNPANRNGFYLKLQSLFQSVWPRALRFARKEK